MKFSIRDDDICYHTKAEDILRIYGDISLRCPISFSCIPFVGGYSVESYSNADWDALDTWWRHHQTNEIYDIAKNLELVDLLRDWIINGRAAIMLHGIHHTLFEFDTNEDISSEISAARKHLEKTFGCDVSVATPPNNTLSKYSALSLASNNMNILVAYGHTPFERQFSLLGMWSFLKLLTFFARHGKKLRFPYPLSFPNHKEQACYHLGPSDCFEELAEGLDYAHRTNGNFVLGTHFYHMTENDNIHLILKKLIERANSLVGNDSCFVVADKLFE